MAKGTAKVTVKKGSKGGKKAPIRPNMTPKNGGGLFATQIRLYIEKKKNQPKSSSKNG